MSKIDFEQFEVKSHPVMIGDVIVPNKKILAVDDQFVNLVSGKYQIHQPMEVFESFNNVADKCGLDIQRVISSRLTGGMIIEAKYDTVSFVGEEHDVTVVFFTDHTGRYCTSLSLNTLRHLCMNQAAMLSRGKDRHLFKEKHYNRSLDIDNFERLLEYVPQSVEMYNARMEQLLEKKFTYGQFQEFFIRMTKLDKESKQYQTKIANLKDCYYNAQGQDVIANDTGYKAFNVISFMNTHQLRESKAKTERLYQAKAKNTLAMTEALLAA